MTEDEIYKIVKDTIIKTFNIDESRISPDTPSDEIEEWDSLGHIRLILELESAFKIKFNTIVIPKLTNVKAIILEIKQHG